MKLKDLANIETFPSQITLPYGKYPVFGSGLSIIGYTEKPVVKEPAVLVSAYGYSFAIRYVEEPCSVSKSVYIIRSSNPFLVYTQLLKAFDLLARRFYSSTPGRLRLADLKELEIQESTEGLEELEKLYKLIQLLKQKEQKLIKLRNAVLENSGLNNILTGGYLSEFVSISAGFPFRKEDFLETGTPVVKGSTLVDRDFRVSKEHFAYVQKEVPDRHRVRALDVVVLLSGTVGKTSMYNLTYPALLNQRLVRLRVRNYQVLNPEYLLCWVSKPSVRAELQRRSIGEFVKGINPQDISNLKIRIPKKEEQRNIIHFLHRVNQLNNLFNKKIKRLEQLFTRTIRSS